MTEYDAEINSRVRYRAWSGDEDYSVVWGRAYRKLCEECGFAPPEDAKNRLDAVQAAGHLETLWHVVRRID